MSIREYLDSAPMTDIIKYRGGPGAGAVAFVGTLRKHPYDEAKCLLFTPQSDALGAQREGAIFEFRISDVLGADEMSSPVDESGAAMSRARLWIRHGAIALRYEPFEVGESALDRKHAGSPT
ncbi:MAG: hypothetical protein ABFC81_05645 [Rectinema sp.]